MSEKKSDAFLRGLTSNIPLTGTDDEIKTQLSLLLGIGQLMEAQYKGLDIDFYKFIELFEDGFSSGFLPKQNVSLNPKYWGQTQKTRPKVRVLLESSKEWQKQGFALIELQPDRTIEDQSYLLFGTPMQLIQQIMYWMNYHRNKSESVGGSDIGERLPYDTKGFCLIKLVFVGQSTTHKVHRVRKAFRWVRADPSTVSAEEITRIAHLIKTKFDPSFSFSTGHIAFTYNNPSQGFNRAWSYFNSVADAKKLFEQLLDLQNFSPDWSKLTQSTVVQPGNRFQSPGKHIKQGGVIVRAPEERPIATVRFKLAYLKFPYVKETGILVDSRGAIMDAKKFLAQYQD